MLVELLYLHCVCMYGQSAGQCVRVCIHGPGNARRRKRYNSINSINPQHQQHESTLNHTDQTVETGRYAETPPAEFAFDYDAAVAEIDGVYDNAPSPPENPFLGDMSV